MKIGYSSYNISMPRDPDAPAEPPKEVVVNASFDFKFAFGDKEGHELADMVQKIAQRLGLHPSFKA